MKMNTAVMNYVYTDDETEKEISIKLKRYSYTEARPVLYNQKL